MHPEQPLPFPTTPLPRAVLLDAGFTLTFYDGAEIATAAAAAGVTVSPAALEEAEAGVRRDMARYAWAATVAEQTVAKQKAGPAFFRRMLELAGAVGAPEVLDLAAETIWSRHLQRNFCRRVGAGVDAALARLRAAGIKLAVVSNSEGTVEAMLEAVGLRRHLDAVFDSWVVGVAKPDPAIFRLALERLEVAASEAVMVGDAPAIDVAGAQAAGIRAVLVDPYDLHPAATVPRFGDLPAFTEALLLALSQRPAPGAPAGAGAER